MVPGQEGPGPAPLHPLADDVRNSPTLSGLTERPQVSRTLPRPDRPLPAKSRQTVTRPLRSLRTIAARPKADAGPGRAGLAHKDATQCALSVRKSLLFNALHKGGELVGERGFQTRIALTKTHGFPRFLQDCGRLVLRLCVPVQCHKIR